MKDILTVSQLNDDIKTFLEEAFGMIWVEGEVSNLRRPQSGHIYFTLKDDKSQIRAVYFRQFGSLRSRQAGFDLEDGMKILCRARLSAYPPRGEYQLIVESVEPRGAGALQKAFEQLKAKLAAEGLFDAARKKALPYLPKRIGIITSPTGAVIRDILNVTRRRFPSVDILIAPTRVQGAEAAGEIIAALSYLQASGNVDVIIIARGGGSLEDLTPFNDEVLAREIFRSSVPVVSAIGHETDFTICDFVADLRAPTPSAAAELVLPEQEELQNRLQALRQRLISAERRYIDDRKEKLQHLQKRFKDPRRFLIDFTIHLDDLRERIRRAATQNTRVAANKLRHLELGLQARNPMQKIRENRVTLANLEKDMITGWKYYLGARSKQLEKNAALINSLSPLTVLQRGYSITRRLSNGEIIRRASRLTLDERIAIQLAQGSLEARVEKIIGD
jgi:exodeoxyribonuclease VII large subunit